MARPILDTIDVTDANWLTKLNSNFSKLLEAPLPFPLLTSGPAGGLWTPSNVSTELWFDPLDTGTVTTSGSDLTQIDDKSGNARHAVTSGTGVTVAGDNYIDFNADTTTLTATHAGLSLASYSVFQVYELTSTGTWGRFCSWVAGGADFSNDNRLIYLGKNNTSTNAFIYPGDGRGSLVNYTGIIGDTLTHVIHQNTTGTAVTTSLDGTTGASATWGSGSTPMQNPATVFNADGSCDFRLKEFILTSSALSSDDIDKMTGYLAWRHGTEGLLPVSHPYKSAAPYVSTQPAERADLFDGCIGILDGVLWFSNGTSWYRLGGEVLDYIAALDTGTATLNDCLTLFNNLLTDMRDKGWMIP